MKLYSEEHPAEATPIQKAHLAAIAKNKQRVDPNTEGSGHVRGSESKDAHFVTVGQENGKAAELIRIAKPNSPDFVTTGQESAAESGNYGDPITREAAAAAIRIARKQ